MAGRCCLLARLAALVLSSLYKNSSHSTMDSPRYSLLGQAAPTAPTGTTWHCWGIGAHTLATTARAKVQPDTKAAIYRLVVQEAQPSIKTLPSGDLLYWTVAHQASCLSPGCLKTRGPLSGQKVRVGDFPGDTVDKTLSSQCRGPGFDPWSGN